MLSSGLRLSCRRKIGVDFLEVWNAGTKYAEIVGPLRIVLVVDIEIFCGKFPCTFLKNSDLGSCLQLRVSSHFRSTLHLLATFENLTLRHFDLNLQRQVSQHIVL